MAITMTPTKQMTMTIATATATTMTMTTPTTTMTMETMPINLVHTKTFILRMPSHVGIIPIGCNRCRRFVQNCFRLGGGVGARCCCCCCLFLPPEIPMARLRGMGKSRFKSLNPLHSRRCSSYTVFPGKKFRRCFSARALADISGSGGGCSPSEDRMSFWPAAGALAGTDTCGGGGVASAIGADSAEGRADATKRGYCAGGTLTMITDGPTGGTLTMGTVGGA